MVQKRDHSSSSGCSASGCSWRCWSRCSSSPDLSSEDPRASIETSSTAPRRSCSTCSWRHSSRRTTIQKMVCEYYEITYDKLQAKTRKREIVQARQISMFLAKQFTKNSLKTIGDHFGGRDHTTVIHSCQTVKDLMDTDTMIRDTKATIENNKR